MRKAVMSEKFITVFLHNFSNFLTCTETQAKSVKEKRRFIIKSHDGVIKHIFSRGRNYDSGYFRRKELRTRR